METGEQKQKKLFEEIEWTSAGGILGLVTIMVFFLVLNYFNMLPLSQIFPSLFGSLPHQPYQKTQTLSKKAIAKVGNETLYQSDLDTELKAYPPKKDIDRKAFLVNKLIKDSIILQQAQKENLITLNETVFNSPTKDYAKRLATVQEAIQAVKNQAAHMKGKIVTIWFYNLEPAAIGTEKGKQLAFSKITKLHDDVASKKITIEKAGELIKQDASLAQVDRAYKQNAIFDFDTLNNDRISFDPSFDKVVRNTNKGEITSVFLSKDRIPGTQTYVEAVYLFARVDEKRNVGRIVIFDQWFQIHEKSYTIIRY